MRVTVVATGAIGLLALGAFLQSRWQAHRDESAPAVSRSPASPRSADPATHGKVNQSLAYLQNRRLSAVDDELAAVNERLKSLESARGAEQSENESVGDKSSVGESRPLSNRVLLDWMDKVLTRETSDPNRTAQVEAQIRHILPAAPGVRLEQAECGERFCRATFAQDDGGLPDVMPLFGEGPPFVNYQITSPRDDGRVVVYFTSKDISIETLRAEALQSASN